MCTGQTEVMCMMTLDLASINCQHCCQHEPYHWPGKGCWHICAPTVTRGVNRLLPPDSSEVQLEAILPLRARLSPYSTLVSCPANQWQLVGQWKWDPILTYLEWGLFLKDHSFCNIHPHRHHCVTTNAAHKRNSYTKTIHRLDTASTELRK